ncbi:CHAT domain-containing protein, partial [Mesorhizobium sp. LNJC395A00]|uniref:CHAT domain-containing protein n=1 Tax=Mesorhizobium sp. LNJC395A00 TaxID=1287275 RepID=UPI0004CF3F80
FFYAGSRALLVSHWPVASSAAVEITTATLQRLQAADGSLSRAEALRRSMLELLSSEPVSPIAAPTQIDKARELLGTIRPRRRRWKPMRIGNPASRSAGPMPVANHQRSLELPSIATCTSWDHNRLH